MTTARGSALLEVPPSERRLNEGDIVACPMDIVHVMDIQRSGWIPILGFFRSGDASKVNKIRR